MLHITPMSRRRWRIAAIACALPVAMLLAGCGKKQAEPAVVGQVIAHVGPDDVTQQELDNELRLANVPADVTEAARIDGAGPFRQAVDIELPMISPALFFAVVTTILAAVYPARRAAQVDPVTALRHE